jgi:N-formylglutamate deformylase
MQKPPFTVHRPQTATTSVIFASPHSGSQYSEAFLSQTVLSQQAIRSSEDAFVDNLISNAPRFGASTISATMPRAYLDLNRSADELDPAVIAGLRSVTHNPRISSGLGVIPRVVANGRAIYRGKISLDEAQSRISDYWWPYHRQLAELLNEAHDAFGQAILLDMHSMPHEALEGLHPNGGNAPDVVLGDRFGAAASSRIVDVVEAAFSGAGLRVARNAPFAGAYIAQRYGRPKQNQHAVQVEIDRALYMDEARITPRADFAAFKSLLTGVMAEICGYYRSKQMPHAAE